MRVARGQVWFDASEYIPGYGKVSVVGVQEGVVTFRAKVGLGAPTKDYTTPTEMFVRRFRERT